MTGNYTMVILGYAGAKKCPGRAVNTPRLAKTLEGSLDVNHTTRNVAADATQVHPASAEAFRTGRTTIYKGIVMRSRLEAAWAGRLDEMGFNWAYEPRCFADETGQYLPDFYVDGICEPGDADGCYVDVKGVLPSKIGPLRNKMEIIWSSEPDVSLVIVEGSPTMAIEPHMEVAWFELGRSFQLGCMMGPDDPATDRLWETHDVDGRTAWEDRPRSERW